MQQRQFSRESGFSIIELIITVGVLSIVALGSATLMSDMSHEAARSRRVQSRGNFEKTMVALYQKTDLCSCNLGTAALAVPSTGSVAVTGLKSGCATATNDFYDSTVAGGFPVDTNLTVTSITVSDPQFISGNDYSATVTINYADSPTLGSLRPGKYIFMFAKTVAAGPPYVVSTCTIGGSVENGSSISWSLLGNPGTSAATNFLGTTDDNDLIFKRNNITAGALRTTNTSFGVSAMASTTTGGSNTALGTNALHGNTTGSFNIGIGVGAGGLSTDAIKQDTGSDNIYIGRGTGPGVAGISNSIGIGRNAKPAASNVMLLGGTGADAVNVGIGTTTPGRPFVLRADEDNYGQLEVQNFSATAGTTGASVVLRNNNTEAYSFAEVGIGGANATWAASLVADKAFLYAGPDTQGLMVVAEGPNPVSIATDNIPRLHVTGAGYVGIGTTTPSSPFQFTSDLAIIGDWGLGIPGKDMWFDGGSDGLYYIANTSAIAGAKTVFASGPMGAHY